MPSSITLIFTVALKNELPTDWLRQHSFPVCSLAAAHSGYLNSLTSLHHQGVLFLITGVGLKNSKKAAQWIQQNLNPLFVVNLGGAGTTKRRQGWIFPDIISSDSPNDPTLSPSKPPLALCNPLQYGGELRSFPRPVLNSPGNAKACDYDYADMEAYAQAKQFHGSSIKFTVIKYITDYCNSNSPRDYQLSLSALQNSIKTLLKPLTTRQEETISVIIPVHNRQNWIPESIQSVIEQTYPAYEIIVVDDGSDDKLEEAIQAFTGKIKLIRHPQNKGVSAARNTGAKAATGDWLAFLDSDDRWHAKKLASQVNYLKQNPYFLAVQCNEIWIRNNVRVNAHKHHKKPQGWIWQQSLKQCFITPSALLMKKDIFFLLGGFDENILACEDYDLWLRLSRLCPVGLLSFDGVIKYGGHDDQLSLRHPAMDRFRVYALLKALRHERDPTYQQALLEILVKKLNILTLGAQKRQQEKTVTAYEALLHTLQNDKSSFSYSLDSFTWLLTPLPAKN